MKYFITILFIIFSLLLFESCDHKLDLTPDTELSVNDFFATEEDFEQAVSGAYESLRFIAFSGIFMDEMRSDNTFFTFYPPDRGTGKSIEAWAEFRDDDLTSIQPNSPGDRYGSDYTGIARANVILQQLEEEGVNLSKESMESFSGQALFLRAFYYYDLVTHFGGVPLQLEPVENAEDGYLPRNSLEEVYSQIIIDIEKAINQLKPDLSFPQDGKASEGAARMLLAYVYITKPDKEYDKAEDELKKITKMGYSLEPNYRDVFDPNNKNNIESIFEIQYKEGEKDGQQSDFNWRFIPKTKNPEKVMGVTGTNLRGGITSGGWNVPTEEMVQSYDMDDLRLDASIGVAVGHGGVENFVIDEVMKPTDFDPSSEEEYYYFINKYLYPPYETEWDTPENFPVFRYSDVLLLLSETLVEQGKNNEALPFINEVRLRAGIPPVNSVDLDLISTERRHELAFENHRWLDLKRMGKAIETLNKKGDDLKKIHGWLNSSSFDVTEDKLIYAIPRREIEVNPDIEQNPGY